MNNVEFAMLYGRKLRELNIKERNKAAALLIVLCKETKTRGNPELEEMLGDILRRHFNNTKEELC